MSEIIGKRRLKYSIIKIAICIIHVLLTCKMNEWNSNKLPNNYDSINLVIMGQKSL